MKNEYEMGTPEWQLFEVANSARLNSITMAKMADEKLLKAQQERERAELYEASLKKIDPEFPGFKW